MNRRAALDFRPRVVPIEPKTYLQKLIAGLGRGALYSLLVGLSFTYLLPFLWMLSSSLKYDEQVYRLPPTIIPDPVRWANYPEAFEYLPWGLFTYNTVFRYAIPSVIGVLISSCLVAYAFSRIRWRLREPLFYICVGTMMIPFQVTMIPLFVVFHRLGWTNTYLPLVIPAFAGAPYYIFLLRQFFLSIPEELSDAARIDGCSELMILGRIILPLAKPAISVVALFQFNAVWHDYLGPLIYLNRREMFPIALGMEAMRAMLLFQQQFQVQAYPFLMAISATFAIPIIVLFFLTQRTFIEGIAVTGLKG